LALQEGRANPRFYFHPTEEKLAQVRTSVSKEGELSERLHQLVVCDISKGGMALFVPESSKRYFEPMGRFKVVGLGIHRLNEVVKGEVIFRIPFSMKGVLASREGFKVGVKFDQLLEDATLDRFVQKRTIFSLTEAQIVRDEAFRKTVQSNMAEIRKKISGKKSFRDLFQTLEKPGPGGYYLKQHILLLCQVMSGLGTRLGWISEKSIDKLIYVAYLHDVRFSDLPHLARIASKREFQKMLPGLSEGEQKAFLEAPVYAADLALQDLESYPDAIKILAQQKELPDGSGYPHGLTGSLIAPLSALFIVSHYFVDYVIDHPDWTADDFVKTYRGRFKGQYFQKIFQAMLK
jgi:hypothetical protein